MKNYTNIYDIDGNIIRRAGDTRRFTLDEVEKMVDNMTEKVQNNPENKVYKVYLNNLHKYLHLMYSTMDRNALAERPNNAIKALTAKNEEDEKH